ncbi:MAG: hypothetical protein ABL894_13340, partial [Hyphomicrobium sp.]
MTLLLKAPAEPVPKASAASATAAARRAELKFKLVMPNVLIGSFSMIPETRFIEIKIAFRWPSRQIGVGGSPHRP